MVYFYYNQYNRYIHSKCVVGLINLYFYVMKIFICIRYYFNKIFQPISDLYYLTFENNILFIKNSKIVNQIKNLDGIDNITNIYINYDYIIYKINVQDKCLITIHNDINNINDLGNNDCEVHPCNFTFLLVVIKTNEKSYDITEFLKNPKNYYYVTNNILFNKLFMNWLFISHIKEELLEYSIVFLDNTITEITIDKTQYIKLNNTNYDIINVN
jgi:hypothetical protein